MAAAMAMASSGCVRSPRERIVPWVDMPEAGVNGVPLYYATAWRREGRAHGVLVATRDGRPIKIEGNPSHPSSLGATDAQTQASILDLWDPDRSQIVRQRLEARPAGQPTSAPSTAPPAATSTWPAFEAAWRERAAMHRRERGARLRILAGPFTSPSLQMQVEALMATYPKARWHRHDTVETVGARAAARLAFGREIETVLHLDRARFVATFDADPFAHGAGRVRHARDWSRQRAAGLGEDGASASAAARMAAVMASVASAASVGAAASATPASAGTASSDASACVIGSAGASAALTMAVETAPTLFGARAQERLVLAPSAIEALLWRVASRLHADLPKPSGGVQSGNPAAARLETLLGEQLQLHGAQSLLIAGTGLSASTQALVHLLNRRSGACGCTLDAIEPLDGPASAGTLAELVEAMQGDAVDTLLVLGANPVYDAPGDIPFAAALARVPFSVHLGLHHDETARRCIWSLPASHDYEQWSDARGHDGSVTLLQPTIAPLYATRSVHELLAWMVGGETDAHALVRTHWRSTLGDARDFEVFWTESLRRGVIADSASTPLKLPEATIPSRPQGTQALVSSRPSSADGMALEAVFSDDPSVGAGAQSNNAWLQELPRPFTKLTWDNVLLLGPETAKRIGLTAGDVVIAASAHARVEAPVWVQAGHAEGAVSVPLGQGRRGGGRVAERVGFDAYPLRAASGAAVLLHLERTGRRRDFAVTQHETEQHGRNLARTLTRGQRIPHADTEHASLYPPVEAGEHRWAMVIDLDACIGCNACSIACQTENNIPVVGVEEVARGRHMQWLRIDRYDAPGGRSLFQPVPCMHCENAPCELVCPVGATLHDSDGLNVQVYNRCIGTRFCSNNCPYKVRRFNFLQYADTETESLKAQRNPDVTVRQRGVMEKCTYCIQRLSRARIHSDESGAALRDGDVQTACQSVCPTRAIHFGDLADRASDVVRLRASPRHYAMLGELNTRPRTTYLARVVEKGEGG
jgi:molybdopterin-containing oxidoreductase family iron-sulfur binding subunit